VCVYLVRGEALHGVVVVWSFVQHRMHLHDVILSYRDNFTRDEGCLGNAYGEFLLVLSDLTWINLHVKVKVKLSLCLTKHHAMKAYWVSGGIAPLIL
jgi:hypothetical protein